MVGTVSAARHRRRAGAAFAAGLVLGAAAIFVALAAVGAAAGSRVVLVAALAVGAVAVVSDALGLRVRPQIHLQVPEPWRRTMPLERALFLYGLLLGTGLTTYVPATAAWALPVLCLALGSLTAALAIAAGFAAGRALPVLVLAARGGETVLAERPQGLRLLRTLAAVSLLCALVAGRVEAAGTVASPAGDPSAVGADLAWQQPGVGGFLRRDGTTTQLPGTDPAVGATFVAWRAGPTVTVADRATLTAVFSESLPGVTKLAISRRWLAYRTPTEIRVEDVAAPGTPKTVVRVKQPATLGRPALGVDLVAFHRSTHEASWITAVNVVSGRPLQLRFSRDDQLLSPSLLGGQLLYVRSSRCSQQLVLGRARGGRRDRVLYTIGPLAGQDQGHERHHTRQGEHLPCPYRPRPTSKMLWTTALSPTTAYVTVLKPAPGGHTVPTLLAVSRR
jgi:hypothetical protein